MVSHVQSLLKAFMQKGELKIKHNMKWSNGKRRDSNWDKETDIEGKEKEKEQGEETGGAASIITLKLAFHQCLIGENSK